ncbi:MULTISPECIES: strawberry notch family protein [Sphingobium]|jgi:predicted RNA methylase|uniref:strawberry notch family protein n=2 Tax=Sphingomonadaceae TaxID=41297 RepID=UPI001980AB2E|nr:MULTISPECIES: strawberry notch family protein [Sphingomonadaceae]MCC4257522.1 strawberry notch family protein [Sphingobium lactosutens]|tara:strand:+ start:10693 stop:14892 length:4200 start_codon:yes stop_codon:yes gene_type:complete
MATQPLAVTLPLDDPARTAAQGIADRLSEGRSVARNDLLAGMTSAFGGSSADGLWSLRDAYDVLELAQILHLKNTTLPADANVRLAQLIAMTAALPTHSVRSETQVAFQQFSTPAPIGFLAARAAAITARDIVLEPSAGTGLLAVHGHFAGARLLLNEIDAWRARLLRHALPEGTLSTHDGELIDDMLDPQLVPSVVLINPPFSRSQGRGRDRHAALRHLRSALLRLAPGGRCAVILPDRIETGDADWLHATAGAHLRLHLDLPPHAYAKHGTGQAVQLILLEKGGAGDCVPRQTCTTFGAALAAIDAMATPCAPTPQPISRPSGLFRSLTRRTRPVSSRVAVTLPTTRAVVYHRLDAPAPAGEPQGIYLPYRPSRLLIADAREHPSALVESQAMGSIAAPPVAYEPVLPARILDDGLLSDAQLETLIYAGAAFERDLPGRFISSEEGLSLSPAEAGNAYRTGFFLGDGTGAGKGRQVAGVILDQWLRGNRRHLWISKSETLIEDARRDWSALGGLPLDIQHLNQWKLGTPIALGDGILFLTYATLRSNRGDRGTRLRQLIEWMGEDFSGVIVFDEAHEMAGVAGGEGRFGATKGSEQGIAGVRLQNLAPRARILYASATGASDVNNLAYATRLGLWGPQTAFADRRAFVESLRRGGIAAMELIARDLKAQGLYAARALSFAGVEYDILEHRLSEEQIAVYNAYADAWAIIHNNLQAALAATRVTDGFSGATYNSGAKAAALSIFESTKQRFFGQILLSMKLPSLIPAIAADLARGDCAVVQLVSTSEAMLDRALADLSPEERAWLDIELSPREFLVDYLTAAFPVRQMRTYTDDSGTVRSEPMIDEAGQPVLCREAIAMRDQLLEQLCALPVVGSALDHIIGHFGTEAVAEVTGRSRRIIVDADGRQRIERRSARTNLAETDIFMRGEKRILIFSDAGGTGRSYHASLDAPNQSRRIHYLLEPGWRADAAIQGLGRTHRTHQACPPLFRPVSTDCRGERRFISTIARRLDSLGALTRGQRQTGGQGLFDPRDNLESDFARESLDQWFRLLFQAKLQSVHFDQFQALTGLNLAGEGGGLTETLPTIQRWLNRILALRIDLQNAIFDEYLGLIEARVEKAREAGTLDLGVETIAADRISILDRTVIRRDPVSGAETEILRIETEERYRPLTLERAHWLLADPEARRLFNPRSGKAAICRPTFSLTDEEGRTVRRYELVRPTRTERHRQDLFAETHWTDVDRASFDEAWQAECDAMAAQTRTQIIYLVTGLLLPVWGKLPDDHVQVWRLMSDDGQSLLGRLIPAPLVERIASAFGIAAHVEIDLGARVQHVRTSGEIMPIGALRLKRALVAGDQRLELLDWKPEALPHLKAAGCFTEIIQHRTRLFVPPSRALEILARITD